MAWRPPVPTIAYFTSCLSDECYPADATGGGVISTQAPGRKPRASTGHDCSGGMTGSVPSHDHVPFGAKRFSAPGFCAQYSTISGTEGVGAQLGPRKLAQARTVPSTQRHFTRSGGEDAGTRSASAIAAVTIAPV